MMAPDGSKLRSVTEVDNWHTLHNKVYVLCSYARARTHTHVSSVHVTFFCHFWNTYTVAKGTRRRCRVSKIILD
jgi:hypothetical protein